MPALGLRRKQAETFNPIDDEDLMKQAIAALHRHQQRLGAVPMLPNDELSHTCVSDQTEHEYAVLQNINGVLAVYMQPAGAVKIIRLETWPDGLSFISNEA